MSSWPAAAGFFFGNIPAKAVVPRVAQLLGDCGVRCVAWVLALARALTGQTEAGAFKLGLTKSYDQTHHEGLLNSAQRLSPDLCHSCQFLFLL